MSEDENVKGAKNAIGSLLETIKKLKESNPKVLYGGGAALVILILFMMMSGGSKTACRGPSAQNLAVGQTYVLREPNSYDGKASVRLVAAPGSMAAYDDTEKADREGCKHLPQGTPVVLKAFDNSYGEKSFSKVSVKSGECEGSVGWTLSINISDK